MIRHGDAHDMAQPGTPSPGHTLNVFSRTVTALIVLLLLLLSACGGGEETPQEAAQTAAGGEPVTAEDTAPTTSPPTAEPSATPLPSPTTPPTPTTAPSPTATPDPAAGFVPLDYDELGLSLSAPADWHAESLIDLVFLATAEELIDAPDIGGEGAVMVVAAGDTAEMAEELDTRDPLVALSSGFEDLGFGQQTELVEGPTAATIAGLPAAVARYEAVSDSDVPLAGIMVLIIGENRSAVAFGATPQDSAEQYLPVMEAVAASIELSQEVAVVEEEEDPLLSIDGTLFPGETASGELVAGGRSSWLIFSLADEIYDIRVNPLSGDLDIVLDVLDEAGESILEDGPLDESFGEEEILDLQFDIEGFYTLVIAGYEPEMSGEFEIELVPAQPRQETSGTESQGGITYGEALTAAFDGTAETLQFPFNGLEGDIAQFVVTPQDDLDVVVDIVDANGDSLVPAGHDNHGSGAEIVGARLPADGTYALLVSPYLGETEGEFEVNLTGPGGTEIIVPDAFAEDGEEHAFPFAAVEGDVVQLYFQPDSDIESELGVYDSVTDSELIRLVRSPGAKGLGFEVTEDGDYYYLAAGFSAGDESSTGAYTATLLGSEDVLFELAAGDSARGRFPDLAYGIGYQYFGSEGETIVVTVQTDEDSDAVIEVYDEEDNQLAYVDETVSPEAEVLTYTFDADRMIYIVITELGFETGTFELTLERG